MAALRLGPPARASPAGRRGCFAPGWRGRVSGVVLPTWDKTLPPVAACLDVTFRAVGDAPTYVLTDNEKPVTTGHVAGLAVRNGELVAIARHYGVSVHTCVPADPESKGGSEAAVRIAKAELVPTEANLLADYSSFADLEAACEVFGDEVNHRAHRETGRAPAEVLADERPACTRCPLVAYVAAFGQTRRVCRDATISVGGCATRCRIGWWMRRCGCASTAMSSSSCSSTVSTAPRRWPGIASPPRVVPRSATSTTRPARASPPNASPEPPAPTRKRSSRSARARGSGCSKPTSPGRTRVPSKLREALTLARLVGVEPVDRALGMAAAYGRFGDSDLACLLAHARDQAGRGAPGRRGPHLQQGLDGWEALRR